MEYVLLELLVELTPKDHQLALVFAVLDSPATITSALVAPQELFGAQLPVNVSTFVGKTQLSHPLLMLVFVMTDLDC